MSTNQVQPGKSVLVTAGGTVASGSVQEVGSDFIGVALGAATNGTDYQLALEGVFNIAQKTSETWSQGDKIYWDSSAATASKTYAAGAADAFIGVATAAVAANAGTGPVKLRGGAEAEVDLDDVVLKSLYYANTILIATADNTPIALTVAASRIVGRSAAGDIDDLTAAQTRTIAGVSLANKAGTAAPSVGDDNTAGYELGSVWADGTNDKAYVVVDVSTGAAMWHEVSPVLLSGQLAITAATSGTASIGAFFNGKVVKAYQLTSDANESLISAAVAGGTLTITVSGSMTGKYYYEVLNTAVV